MESAEWGRNEDQMEELARSMRHLRREQMQTYGRRKSSAKISSAVCNIATETATALGLSVGSSAEGAQEKKDDDEYSPEIGDVAQEKIVSNHFKDFPDHLWSIIA